MKQFRLLLTILTLLAIGSMNTWAETLTISGASSGHNAPWSTSYGNGNGTSITSGGSSIGITYTNTTRMSTAIQIKKGTSNGFYSTTFPANSVITSIAITSKTNSVTLYVSKDGKSWGTGATINKTTTKTYTAADGYLYFKVNATSSYAQITSIVVTYEATASCTTPTFAIADKTISLSEAETGDYDMSSNLTINKGGSTGAITYSCDNSDVDIMGDKFQTMDAGTYTINATMAADATYCEATTSFTITVQSAPCNALTTPTGLNTSNITATTADLSWTAVPNATEYKITYGDAENPGTKQATATGTTYTLTNLTPKTGHIWAVKAIGDGATYCDSEDSQSGDFTTAAPPQYTITWSVNGTTTTTQVTEGDAIGTLPADPSAPSGCSDKVFVGWSTTNIGATPTNDKPDFITANTIPTGNTTYYAVFATKANTSGSQDIVFNVGDIAAENNWNSGTQYSSYTIAPITITYSGGVNDGKYYSDDSWRSYKNGSVVVSGGTISEVISSPEKTFTKQTDGTWKYTGTATVKFTKFTIKTTAAGSSYTDYITECVDCTDPAEALALTLSQETANLGQDGNAVVTFSTTGGNGTAVTYAVTPTTGATLNGTTITFTQEGTYTLTASQTYTTTGGTTYCGGTDSKKIVITKTPTLYFTTTPADPIEFAEVECGGNTPLSQKQQISVQGYNLTDDVTVTVTGAYKIARTESASLDDYTTKVELTKTTMGSISTTYQSVYVLSCPPAQSTTATTGTITFTTTGGNTLTVNLSTPTVTCREYTLTLYDRGSTTTLGNYYAGAEVPQPADPEGVCTEPINYVFDGWATAEVAEGSTTYTKVSFPYTMPKANTTLYAVYKYEGNTVSDTRFRRGTLDDLVDAQKVVIVEQDAKKALNSKTYQSYYLTATDVTINNDLINVTNDALIWETRKDGDKYSFLQNSKYLNITKSSTHYNLTVTSTKDSWSIAAFGTGYSLQNTTYTGYYAVYNSKYSEYTADDAAYALQFYVPDFVAEYTTAPSCSPFIEGTDDITVTSAKGIWVEAVEPLNITATNLDKNADGANVTITATSLTDGFTLKTQGTNGSGSRSVPLATGYSNSTYNANLTVVYTPTADNIIEEGKIALRVYRTGGTTTYATDTIIVRGRSLPAEFVLAAKTADGWVALPSDLDTGSSSSLKAPYSISVDDETNPTKATEAPKTAVYSAADRSTKNTAATGIRLKNAGGLYLQGSTAQGTTNIWLSANNSEQAQSWELRSSDFVNYFVRLQAAESGRYLSYDAAQGKIGNYKQQGALRLLPVEKTCVRYDAPAMDVFALKSSAVTLRWLAIEGATDYEYSTDGESTWIDCANLTATATEVKWTLDGLTANTKYTLYVRVKVASGETNCSASDSETFTTPDCDDVPTELKATTDANSATITWQCNAATATVKIYSDAQGETEVTSQTNTTSPCTITDLVAGTKYYYQVFADGSCGSAIAHFTTESADVSIVEWGKDYVTVDINTDVDGVSLVVENQVTHRTGTGNVADDLFFSKYYEATGNVKLVGLYNGTHDTISLENICIYIGREANGSTTNDKWTTKIPMQSFGRKKTGFIAPDEEIILWSEGNSSQDNTIAECVAGKMDVNIMEKEKLISFGGRQSIVLTRGDEIIDVIGAVSTSDKDITKSFPVKADCNPAWGDITESSADARTWCGTGYSLDDPTQEIELSMNRCLLVRSNKVKSGVNAVANNVGAFNTLTKDEWLGRQVTEGDDNGVTESCKGFAHVADFDYDGYYATYDSITSLTDLGSDGKRNPDGTFTIPVSRLDTMACTNFRILLKKDGAVIAQEDRKVPIIVDKTTNTSDADYFLPRLTVKTCKECDVIVREGVLLEHTSDSLLQFNNMDIYTGSRLKLSDRSMTVDEVRMHATNDNVSYAILNNSSETGATISINQVVHIKRIDGRYWYPFSLPYDCKIADIRQINGQSLGVFGVDWGIKYYDGQRRQQDGNSTTAPGEVSVYWTMMDANGTLEANKGYIIGLFGPDESLMQSVCFTPTMESNYTESDESKTTSVQNWYTDNLQTTEPRHHGWNFVGSPYISLFGSTTEGEGLYNTSLKMGYTDGSGTQQDADHVYVSIPDPGDANTYTQALASATTLKPFMAYFVQAIDPTDGASHNLNLTYSKSNRSLPTAAPRRTPSDEEKTILAELTITNGALTDNAGILVSDRYTTDYEIGSDLTKMYATSSKPQLYTTDIKSGKMAYQSLPDVNAHNVPLGIYVPAKGDYTLSLNRYASEVTSAEAVYLLYDGAIVANLLYSDYDITATARGQVAGYSIDIRRSHSIATDTENTNADAPHIIVHDGWLTMDNLPAGATVQVYDMLGRLLTDQIVDKTTLTMPIATTGVYTICITAEDYHFVTKTIIR